ncbi:Lacal_2735 family protein [Labilibaculum antarcticum]|uniref:Lacal_2735 family protein n=1 Tax=Labilibaculum antarcticum TaxID=1717717 RepID=A0A1Y1CKQ0_9BACT|nr:Lacal_2735 family protein [Labilibaculum antarcticum]BAX80874.1 hypothetical protein ALGA_2552 [Labilibaculum antarcticum]
MFGLFKKKTKAEILHKKYESLLKECHDLSKVNRSESDLKYVQAQAVLQEIESLQNK